MGTVQQRKKYEIAHSFYSLDAHPLIILISGLVSRNFPGGKDCYSDDGGLSVLPPTFKQALETSKL